MVGSSISIASTNTILNGIVADSIREMADEVLIKKKNVRDVIKETLKAHSRIIFNGNNYSEEWKKEAEKRKLPITSSFVESIKSFVDPHTIEVMERNGIYSKIELESIAQIYYENYSKSINIEARTMIDMASKQYIPSIMKFMNNLAETINNIKKASDKIDISVTEKLLIDISKILSEAKQAVDNLKAKIHLAELEKVIIKKAMFYRKEIFPIMESLRRPIDELELLVDSNLWPVPSYGEMMFK